MAEETNGAAPQQQPQVKMNVLSQYIRDMSFENILARKPASGNVQPDMKVQVALDAKKREAANQYEVLLKLTITSNNKESGDALFLMELEYVGLFNIEGVPDDQIHPFLLIECPRMLFPFARRIVSDVTRDGGFPPLNLETIDFVQLYRAEIQRRAAAQAAPADTLTN
ncbi:protein translocase subunit secB [Pseudooceanicola antarcticus]|uniref:Protein-export protein SecB n=1 Tax=Pseudooceanicola antarcticus TaxID=1247613 RepID=A0A285HVY0_9RHOB|nr:protein-export chaperone SecB [Pseudooceanicola antarcticus]PJE27553.1 protein-export chaperone SecB [Pseudooceanicola antarcticus]SNY38956.1 protein translocase subunit secB [Pseudooceanicola antarcticus]